MVWINLKKKDNKEGNVCKKIFEKNNWTVALNVVYVKKIENISCPHFKPQPKSWKPNYFF